MKEIQNNVGAEATLDQLRWYADQLDRLQKELTQIEEDRQRLQDRYEGAESELCKLRIEKAELDGVFEHALDMFCIFDTNGKAVRVNAACYNVLGYSPQEYLATPLDAKLHPDDRSAVHDKIADIISGQNSINFEARLRHKDGSWRWLAWTCPGRAKGSSLMYAIARDVTDSRKTAEVLLYQAQHDPLTGLGNRALFDQALRQAVSRATRLPQVQVALMILDLDGFKAINDKFGHDAGDKVLSEVSRRLAQRKRDAEIICRLGGDEFGWLLEGPAPLDVSSLAAAILKDVCHPIALESEQVHVGCSIGISLFPGLADNATALQKQADEAMYSVKRSGKMGYATFVRSDTGGEITVRSVLNKNAV